MVTSDGWCFIIFYRGLWWLVCDTCFKTTFFSGGSGYSLINSGGVYQVYHRIHHFWMWDHQDTIKILDSDKSLDLFRGRASFLQTSKDRSPAFRRLLFSTLWCFGLGNSELSHKVPYDHWLVLGCLGVSYNNPLHCRYSRELDLQQFHIFTNHLRGCWIRWIGDFAFNDV